MISSGNRFYEKKRHHLAKQCRRNADAAFHQRRYQHSIELYTKSLTFDNNNPTTYLNRAAACVLKSFIILSFIFDLDYNLNNFDASIQDYSQVLMINSNHIQGFH